MVPRADSRVSGRARVRDVLVISASLAVAAGAVEAAVMAFKRHALGRITFVSPDYWWLTPLAFVAVAVPAALAVALVLLAVRRPMSVRALVGTSVGVLAFCMLLPYTTIGWWAYAILCTGAGLQVSKALGRLPDDRIVPIVRRTGLAAAGLAVLAGAVGTGSRILGERRAMASLPEAGAGAPNVLIIVLDTVRAANLSLHGYSRRTTPKLDSIAASSTVFDQAYSTAPWTLPAHGSLFTGLAGSETYGDWLRPIRADVPTLPEAFARRGYATAGFAANLLYTSYESGVNRGFAHYDDYRFSWPLVLAHTPLWKLDLKSSVPEARSLGDAISRLHTTGIRTSGSTPADQFRPADQIVGSFLDWQREVGDRPFFAFLNLFDAHGPYRAPPDYLARFPGGRPLDKYDAAIAWLDETLGGLVDELGRRGVLDKTILVVTSDHGELFGEHGLQDHANALYLPLIHVPLIVRFPQALPAGTRVATVVSLRDVAATIVELAGITGAGVQGRSLSSTWRQPGAAVHGDVVAALAQGRNVSADFRNARGPMVSRLGAHLHYIVNGDGSEEVYDFRRDPAETRNLIATADPVLQQEIAVIRRGLAAR